MTDFNNPAYLSAFAATASAFAATVSFITAWFAYRVNRNSLVAKFMDRLYELDKLILANPDRYRNFVYATGRDDVRFQTVDKKRTPAYYETIAIALFYMNLFEEIESALNTICFWKNRHWTSWESYIYGRLSHPLLKELAVEHITSNSSDLRHLGQKKPTQLFGRKFSIFLADNQDKWRNRKYIASDFI